MFLSFNNLFFPAYGATPRPVSSGLFIYGLPGLATKLAKQRNEE
jgi:hypothetical protein